MTRKTCSLRKYAFAATVAACLAGESAAKLVPAPIFNNNMVLQREKPVAVWGKADSGDAVTVRFGGKTVSATAGADGRWRVNLPSMSAQRKGENLSISTAKGESLVYTNVVVGEVWLCSGQSNMALSLWARPYIGRHGNRETNGYLDSMIVNEPDIRGAGLQNVWSKEPRDIPPVAWRPFTPDTQRQFSAVAFHYALVLHEALKVPVGVIRSAWGGSAIEPWIPADGFAGEPGLEELATRPIDVTPPAVDEKTGKPGRDNRHQQPRAIYNAMIHPLVPYTIRGAIWYQGESNRADGHAYAGKLRALHRGWSRAFECPDMPFFFVQIAPYGYMGPNGNVSEHCEIWEGMADFARTEKNCGMAVIVDVATLTDIHPGDKRTVSMRLAALALNRTYGRKEIPCDSPELKEWKIEDGAFNLKFDNCGEWIMHGAEPAPFEVAGADGKFQPASAEFKSGGAVKVKSEKVPDPKQLRYSWSWRQFAYLKNEYGLPVGPFRICPEGCKKPEGGKKGDSK